MAFTSTGMWLTETDAEADAEMGSCIAGAIEALKSARIQNDGSMLLTQTTYQRLHRALAKALDLVPGE
jgi:hypothetical protein